jgi:hypothetical protein
MEKLKSKKFYIDFAIYYVGISLVVGFISLLTGFGGLYLIRILVSLWLAYTKPIDLGYGKI